MNILIDPVAGADVRSKLEFQSGRSGREAALLLTLRNQLQWKERGSILLMRAAFATRHPRQHLLNWRTIRSLRAAADAASGYLRPADLAAASKWRPEQRGDQSREFPDLGYSDCRPWLPVWSLYSELSSEDRAAIASRQGLSWQSAPRPHAARFAEQAAREKSLGGQVLQAESRRARVSLQVETSREGRRLVWRVLLDGREVDRLESRLGRRRPIEEQ